MELKKKKKRNPKKETIITIALIIIAGVVGYFAFMNWQGKSQVIEQADVNQNGNLSRTISNSIPPEPPRPPLETSDADFLWIPERDVTAPIIYVDEANEDVFQDALTRGVVHYPGTALPGEPGNPYIFGHSSDYMWKAGDFKQVLKAIIDIPLETKIRITNSEGGLFIYRVIETKIVGPKEVSVLDQFNYERTMLTLQTSWPLGTALKRYIVIAELDEAATYGPEEN